MAPATPTRRARGLRSNVSKPNYLVSEPTLDARKKKKKRSTTKRAAPRKKTKQTESFEVEKILDVRQKGQRHQFLILWKGYDETTWEPMSNLVTEAVKKEARAMLKKRGMLNEEEAPSKRGPGRPKKSSTATAKSTTSKPSYEVEKIVDVRPKGKRFQFEVKWKGYEETTWEPMSHFQTAALKKEAKAILQERGFLAASEGAPVAEAEGSAGNEPPANRAAEPTSADDGGTPATTARGGVFGAMFS